MNGMGPYPYCLRSLAPLACDDSASTEIMPFVLIRTFLSGGPVFYRISQFDSRFIVERRAELASARPSPLIDLGLIHAVLMSIGLAGDLHIAQYFLRVGAGHFQCGHPVNNVDCQAYAHEHGVDKPEVDQWT